MGGARKGEHWESNKSSSKAGGWRGDGKWWPEEEKGRSGGKGGKGGRLKGRWQDRPYKHEVPWPPEVGGGVVPAPQWVPKEPKEAKEAKEPKEKWRSGKGSKDQEERPGREGRSQLSSSAPDFKPSATGLSAMYDYPSVAALANVMPPPMPPNPSYTMPPPPPPAHIAMPPLWQEFADEDGTKYYYNAKTGLSQWERPKEWDQVERAEREQRERAERLAERAERAKATGPGPGGRLGPEEELKKLRREEAKSHEGIGPNGEKGDLRDVKGDGKGKKRHKKPSSNEKEKEPSFGPAGCNLFVFHLPDDWADEDLLEYFAPHGTVVSAKVMKELGTGRSRGFGFVSYEDRVSAATAIKKMQGFKILGKRLKVEFKKGEGDNGNDKLEFEEKTSSGDDERLIGYLRAISAKSVVQSLKESEDRGPQDKGIEDERNEDDPKASLREDKGIDDERDEDDPKASLREDD